MCMDLKHTKTDAQAICFYRSGMTDVTNSGMCQCSKVFVDVILQENKNYLDVLAEPGMGSGTTMRGKSVLKKAVKHKQ